VWKARLRGQFDSCCRGISRLKSLGKSSAGKAPHTDQPFFVAVLQRNPPTNPLLNGEPGNCLKAGRAKQRERLIDLLSMERERASRVQDRPIRASLLQPVPCWTQLPRSSCKQRRGPLKPLISVVLVRSKHVVGFQDACAHRGRH
jgi:hypothetical protein